MNIMASSPIISWQIDGKQWKQWQTLFSWAPKSLQMMTTAMKLKDACSLKKSYDKPRQHIKKQRHYFADKDLYSQSYGFSSRHYGCENCTINKAECWRIDAFELWHWRRFLRVPWTARIQPVHPKGDQSWVFIGRTDAEAETPILWPPGGKDWLTGKDPDAGRDCGQEEKGTTKDEMAGWHHRLDGHEFE